MFACHGRVYTVLDKKGGGGADVGQTGRGGVGRRRVEGKKCERGGERREAGGRGKSCPVVRDM